MNMQQQIIKTAEVKHWYREPMMYLVLGGPLVVVIAAVITAWVAISGADQDVRQALKATPTLSSQAGQLPAMAVRNHANSPQDAVKADQAAHPPSSSR